MCDLLSTILTLTNNNSMKISSHQLHHHPSIQPKKIKLEKFDHDRMNQIDTARRYTRHLIFYENIRRSYDENTATIYYIHAFTVKPINLNPSLSIRPSSQHASNYNSITHIFF